MRRDTYTHADQRRTRAVKHGEANANRAARDRTYSTIEQSVYRTVLKVLITLHSTERVSTDQRRGSTAPVHAYSTVTVV